MAKRNNASLPEGKRASVKQSKAPERVNTINPYATLKHIKRSSSPRSLWKKLGLKTSKSEVWFDEKSGKYYIESDYKRYKSEKIVKRSIENKSKKMRSQGLISEAKAYLESTFLGKKNANVLGHSGEFRYLKSGVIAELTIGAKMSGQTIQREQKDAIQRQIEEISDKARAKFGKKKLVIDINFTAKFDNRYGGEKHIVGLSQQDLSAFTKYGAREIIDYIHVENTMFYPINIIIREEK